VRYQLIKADFHVHSSISFDCEIEMEETILAAIEKGLDAICFTDHLNLIDGEVPGEILTDAYPPRL
jgi:histidinol-phosphatase (PHP family)